MSHPAKQYSQEMINVTKYKIQQILTWTEIYRLTERNVEVDRCKIRLTDKGDYINW